MRPYLGYILWGGYIAFVVSGFIWLHRESSRVHGMIDKVKAEADKAQTREELREAWKHIQEVSNDGDKLRLGVLLPFALGVYRIKPKDRDLKRPKLVHSNTLEKALDPA